MSQIYTHIINHTSDTMLVNDNAGPGVVKNMGHRSAFVYYKAPGDTSIHDERSNNTIVLNPGDSIQIHMPSSSDSAGALYAHCATDSDVTVIMHWEA